MISKVVLVLVGVLAVTVSRVVETDVDVISRAQWGAEAPKRQVPIHKPVPNVVIHHSATPACPDRGRCAERMRSMQRYHQVEQHWDDIGYNFCVGTDGSVFEGRGWSTVGAHVKDFNSVSLGICLIGTWSSQAPPQRQLLSTRALIRRGVKLGHIKTDYALLGHRQVGSTTCPGDALFGEIRTWDNFAGQRSSAGGAATAA